MSVIDAPEARQLTPDQARARFTSELHDALGDDWTVDRFRADVETGELSCDDERVLRLFLLLPLVG